MAPLAHVAGAAWRRPSFLAMLVMAAALLAITSTGAVRAYGRPLPGLFVDPELVVSSVGWPTWSGIVAGLRYPDRVVAVDGIDLSASASPPLSRVQREAAWEGAIAAAARESRDLRLEVQTGGEGTSEVRAVAVSPVAYSGGAWWTQAASLIFAAFLYVVAGLVAMATKPDGGLSRAFVKVAFLAALFLLTSVDWESGHQLGPLFLVAFATLPGAVVVLALRLPDDVPLLRRFPRLVTLVDASGMLLAGAMLLRAARGEDTVALRNVCSALLGGALILYGVTLVGRFLVARASRREKLRSLLAAMVPAHAALGVAILLAASASRFSSLAFCTMPALAFAPFAAVLAFARHDLWSSRALLSRALTHALVALAVGITAIAGGAALVTTLGVPFTHGLAGASAGGGLAAVLVALALRASDRGLFTARAEYKPTIEQLSYDLVLVNRASDVVRAVEQTVRRWLSCESARFELSGDGGSGFEVPGASEGVVLALPVSFRGETLGVLHLGPKTGGALYTSDDLDLLGTIVNQTAVALAHARIYGELEERRQQQIAALRDERLALIETMAAEVAHEVRYPINFFRTIFDPRRRGELDAEALEIGGEEVDRLERLVSGLKRVSSHRVERLPVSLRYLVARVEVLLTDRLLARTGALRPLNESIDPELTLACDFDQITQVLVNLLANALDASGSPDEVGITWRDAGQGGEIVVWDRGDGFDVPEAELFAPWFTTKPRGTGLGLAVSQRIVRSHGWTIGARRAAGRTEFHIGVPARDVQGDAISVTRTRAREAAEKSLMNVLVVDDQRSARRVMREILLQAPDVEIEEAATVDEALQIIERRTPDLLLLDVRLTADVRDRGGLEILRRARALGVSTPAVMITSMTEMADVREAMRAGAQDYVYKDELSPELLLPIVETFRERLQLKAQVARLRERVDGTFGLSAILGDSPAMERLRRLIARVADAPATVLIRGGTGTGKELVARALHETSTRREHPFLAVNCSALPGALIESLVFGHERGAFTGADRRTKGQLELAGHGTILLDEIAEMPWELQAKLLRVLEDRRFRPLGSPVELPLHARILAATHVDLERRIAEGRFREDLFYRLNVVSIDVPSLAERDSDLPLLIAAFAREFPRKLRFTDGAIARLGERRWSGNVRELRNAIQRIALLTEDDVVDAAAVDELVPDRAREDVAREIDRLARALLALPERLGSKLHVIERAMLHHAIETCGGNKSAAARMIGVDRKALERKWDRITEEELPGSDQNLPGSDQRRPPRS